MKFWFSLLLLTLTVACEKKEGHVSSAPPTASLLEHFENISPVGLHVGRRTQGGRRLPVEAVKELLSGDLLGKNNYILIDQNAEYSYYALGKFPYSPEVAAYFLKIPGRYDDHIEVFLILVDVQSGKRIDLEQVARFVPDEGDHYYFESWLIDANGDGNLDIVRKSQREFAPDRGGECRPIETEVLLYTPKTRRFAPAESTANLKLPKLTMSNPLCTPQKK